MGLDLTVIACSCTDSAQGRIQGVASIAWDTVRFSDGRSNYFVY